MSAFRVPPHSDEAEEGVLGCILWDAKAALPECEARFKNPAEAFYDLRRQAIYDTIRRVADSGVPVDLIVVQSELSKAGMLENVGGVTYLSGLMDKVPSAANIAYYADIMVEKMTLRRAIRVCSNVLEQAYKPGADVNRLLDETERDVMAIRPMENREAPLKDTVREALTDIEGIHSSFGAPNGLSTGLGCLDDLTYGMHKEQLIVLAAFPSVGKSALAMNIADHVAVNLNVGVGVFSLEMGRKELVMRMISARARVDLRTRGGFNEGEFKRMGMASSAIARSNLHIIDCGDMTIGQIRAHARQLAQKHNIGLWIVDYLQLATCPEKKDVREQEVAAVADGLKKMARELKAPVIALSQLNDDGKLRESRAIGQHADCLWKLSPVPDEPASRLTERVDLVIEKQRNGPRYVTAKLVFFKTFTKFECASIISDDDVPKGRAP